MATKNTCSICLNNFTKPKLLPSCHHTFCEQCIDGYIKVRARRNKFNCPVCRQQTDVPSGGASQFVTNFYLEDDDDDKQYCTKHKKQEIEVYCRDCRKPCCSVCVMVGHKDHTLADLDQVDQEMREIFMKLKTESEKKIKQLQNHSNFLKTKISDMKRSCKTACDKVQKQIDNICKKARQIGRTIKDDINKIGEDENSKLTKLIEDVDKLASNMRKWCEYSDRTLQQRSIITAVDKHRIAELQATTDYNISTNLRQPVVRHPYYSMVEVDVDCLKRLLGEVQTPTTFTSRFSLNQIVTVGVKYDSVVVIIQGLPWCVCVSHIASRLYIYLLLKKVDKTIETVTFSSTVKLLNINDESKSLVVQSTDTCIPGGYTCQPGDVYNRVYIDWDVIQDVKYGFIRDNKIITVQATVNISDIKLR
ncbi:tripartite motif-containing protein 3-like [Patella vulgata]|uniref:tripartite motif-containing protein 3-like n=1 Tax=Patella vulgata TaxID=6465 RepID=UPI0024A80306|nr:tripartite motif-containing protein 3-like [Patella vulgata]